MKNLGLLVLLQILMLRHPVKCQNLNIIDLVNEKNGGIESCYANLMNVTLKIGNYFIEKTYKINHGELIPIYLKNKINGIEIKSVGLGINGADLVQGQWVSCYGYIMGIHDNSELCKLIVLRSYQKLKRRKSPARDEMIMSCTLGERNKDGKISEGFLKEEITQATK